MRGAVPSRARGGCVEVGRQKSGEAEGSSKSPRLPRIRPGFQCTTPTIGGWRRAHAPHPRGSVPSAHRGGEATASPFRAPPTELLANHMQSFPRGVCSRPDPTRARRCPRPDSPAPHRHRHPPRRWTSLRDAGEGAASGGLRASWAGTRGSR